MVKSVEDLYAWQKARELNKSIYKLLENKSYLKNRGLTDQLQRASISVMLNIAEGFDSGTDKLFYNFLRISFRSLGEVNSIMHISLDLNYISEQEFISINKKITESRMVLSGLMRYLKNKIDKEY